ncbi:MAG: PIN domain-containing protein [Phenylobacterium sp.]|uniref:PIN domain-containing protein n=1 Tax=Phenylobacterium sp. TaxID=1871053 RepID=UPI00273698C0|nr:PIN domain-containing protein [Phenylobacterium sp.]MDP3176011.1 PIN domain-containing protein [Phenylobacterium sp.]
MRLALDTDVAIEVIRGRRPHYGEWLQDAEMAGATLHLSTIVVHELMFGAMASAHPADHMRLVEQLATRMEIHPWASDDAMEAARIRADLKTAGSTVGAMDVLMAGQAVSQGWTLVTGNVREFIRIPQLDILSWADPAGPLDRRALQGRFPTK